MFWCPLQHGGQSARPDSRASLRCPRDGPYLALSRRRWPRARHLHVDCPKPAHHHVPRSTGDEHAAPKHDVNTLRPGLVGFDQFVGTIVAVADAEGGQGGSSREWTLEGNLDRGADWPVADHLVGDAQVSGRSSTELATIPRLPARRRPRRSPVSAGVLPFTTPRPWGRRARRCPLSHHIHTT